MQSHNDPHCTLQSSRESLPDPMTCHNCWIMSTVLLNVLQSTVSSKISAFAKSPRLLSGKYCSMCWTAVLPTGLPDDYWVIHSAPGDVVVHMNEQ